ncbi:AAA family ATPase [Jeotgalicoccus sp. ATCC 8456]|uniref:ATP-binding protein n=1 Tax=Jeotgalicoccus sp. ATCC 8456 TaxID=946435 RepID=UPI0018E6409E|nr:AAA family ATPase [Jeotgalicoccus sp. ATCC 8456]QQD85125.1 AAA family ATPase [Jeotgalicoccus sp. ATCC 8456]
MKILSVNIYGYGKLIKQEYNTNQDFLQVFGENEAGKSTMMSFIHSVLFGFPTKKEQEPRREPRMHNLYGGKLTVQFNDEEEPVEIERLKGKVQGDVKVYFKDGTMRGEEWLAKKLNYIDKRTYRSIFSFDVLGLQDIHKNMTEDKLQEYLLRAGALGSHEYDEMLGAIDKELKTLYKRNGINPTINVELEHLKELNEKIRSVEKQEDRYKYLVGEQVKTLENLNAKKHALNQLDMVRKQKMKEVMYHKDIKDWKQLESKLDIEPVNFPERGIERYESLRNHIKQSARDIGLRQEKLKTLIDEIQHVELPDKSVMEYLDRLQKEEPEIRQQNLEVVRLSNSISNLEDSILNNQRDIGWQEEHLDVDDSNIVRETVQSLLSKYDEIMLEEQYLIREIDHLNGDIKQLDAEIEASESIQIDDQRMAKKRELLDKEFELVEKKRMYQLIEKDYEREKRERDRVKNWQAALIIAISLVAIIIGVTFIINDSYLYGGLSLAIGAAALFILVITNNREQDTLKTDYQDEVMNLQQEIESLKQNHDIAFDIEEAKDLRQELKSLRAKRSSFEVKLGDLNETLSVNEANQDHLNTQLLSVKNDLKVNPDIEAKYIVDAIFTIRDIKQKRRQIDKEKSQLNDINNALNDFDQRVSEEVSNLGIHYSKNAVFHEANQLANKLSADESKYYRLREQADLLENEISVLEERNRTSQRELNELLDYVEADDEEEYYYYARKHEEYTADVNRFKVLSEKLDEEHFDYDLRNDLSNRLLADLKNDEDEINQQIDVVSEQIQSEQQTLVELNNEIKVLESDGKLSELNHLYGMQESVVQSLSEEFMSLTYIKILIETHIKAIKDERLPIVIEEARETFEFVTKGRYINVIYNEEGIFVKHKNGQIFHPLELSQSTKEMLYISLRLSLIRALKGYYQLPIIIDDAFVHFDSERTKTILDYFRTKTNDQVLYFTCNLNTSIPSAQTIRLKEKNK